MQKRVVELQAEQEAGLLHRLADVRERLAPLLVDHGGDRLEVRVDGRHNARLELVVVDLRQRVNEARHRVRHARHRAVARLVRSD